MTHYQLAQAYRYFGDTEREDQELSIVSQIIAQYDDAEADDAALEDSEAVLEDAEIATE